MSRSASSRSRRFLQAFVTASTLVAGGCGLWPFGSDREGEIAFMNDTNTTIDVVYLPETGAEVVLVHAIGPGQSAPSIDVGPCIGPMLVARNQAGDEIDRYEERLCRGDTWRIGGDESSPPS
jgi:hypothetical protein